MARLTRQRGFILWELLLACAVLLSAAGFLFVQGEAVARQYYKRQVRVAAQVLASDLRALQQRALYKGSNAMRKLQPLSADKSVYTLVDGMKVVATIAFSDFGCGEVYFQRSIASVSFGTLGAPTANGEYVLRHRKLGKFSCRVALQPVTGRVLIYEGE